MSERKSQKSAEGDETEAHSDLQKALLANSSRSRILKFLRKNPGLNKHQVADALGIHRSNAAFHLNRMAIVGLLKMREAPNGREHFWFASEDVQLWRKKSMRPLFGRSAPRRVGAYLLENGSADSLEISDAIGLSVFAVRRNIRVLEEVQLVERHRVEQRTVYTATPRLVDCLKRLGEEFQWKNGYKSGWKADK